MFLTNAKSQTIIKGKVIDSKDSSALVGVNVNIKNTGIGVVTDINGNFEIRIASFPKVLVFSYVGYETREVTVQLKSNLTVALTESSKIIDEVVVSAASVKREIRSMSYSTTTVVYDDIAAKTPGVRLESGFAWFKSSGVIDKSPAKTISAGMLTAGEINDFSKWKLWNGESQSALRQHQKTWKIAPALRYSVIVQNQDGFPVIGQQVYLFNKKGDTIWTAKTDNIGKAELWVSLFDTSYANDAEFSIMASFNKKSYEIKKAKSFNNGINHLTIKKECNTYSSAEAVFAVDATGSMGDEISYLKTELNNVIQQVKDSNPQLSVKLGSVFYRDKGDDYPTRKSDLSFDVSKTTRFIQEQAAGGGGDFPEGVDDALDVAINDIQWSDTVLTKIIFLVLDAPPHESQDKINRLQALIAKAAAKGIKIVPVTASGIDKSTEYLMRSWALATNGTYVFLTNHSGIGDKHIEPTTDSYEVEKLNDLLVRVFHQFTSVVSCDNKINATNISDTAKITGVVNTTNDSVTVVIDTAANVIKEPTFSCSFYPNPTKGILNIDIKGNIDELFLNDLSGKILERFEVTGKHALQIDLSAYPKGIYLMTYFGKNDKPITGKIILI